MKYPPQHWTRLIVLLTLVVAFINVVPALAQGQNPAGGPQNPSPVTGPPSPSRQSGPPLGILPPVSQAAHAVGAGNPGGNLSYHNGPVMQSSNTVYAVYWVPSSGSYSVSSGYQTLINGFFQNVAAANGKMSNVYYSDTQYYNAAKTSILYNATFGGSYLDPDALPANGCTDSYTSVCLSDAQLQTEIINAIVAVQQPATEPSRRP